MSGTITMKIKRDMSSKHSDLSRLLLVFLPFLGVAGLIFAPQQTASAAEYTVKAGNTEALIQAIKDANATAEPDIINLEAGVYSLTKVKSEYYDIITVTDPDGSIRRWKEYPYGPNGLPLITSDITIKGEAGKVEINRDGPRGDKTSNHFRFFHVLPSGKLQLEGLTLKNGYARWGFKHGNRGGAILNEGITIIRDSAFKDNAGGDEGGAIMNSTNDPDANNVFLAELEVYNSTFEGNTLTQNDEKGGALGGAIINVAGRMIIDRSTFKGNTTCLRPACVTQDGDGGAVENLAGEAIITNSTFTENKSVSGGAVENNRGKLTIINSTFYKNTATKWAGAIGSYAENSPSPERDALPFGKNQDKGNELWGEGVIIIINSTIIGNHAGDDGIGKEGISTYGGGGILTQKGTILLKNSILAGNTAPPGMPQDCAGYPYFHVNPVYIVSAGNNIIGDTTLCEKIPTELPEGSQLSEVPHGGEPLLVTLETDSFTDLTGDPGVGSYVADFSAPGRAHLVLNSNSPAINAGNNDQSVKLSSKWMGGHVCASPANSKDQLDNAVALEVRDIGAVEYLGSVAAPATPNKLNNMSPFATDAVDCSAQRVFVSTGVASPGLGIGGDTGGSLVNPGLDPMSEEVIKPAVVEAGQAVDSPDVKESTSTSGGGGGALEPWAMLLGMLAIGARLRKQRVKVVS